MEVNYGHPLGGYSQQMGTIPEGLGQHPADFGGYSSQLGAFAMPAFVTDIKNKIPGMAAVPDAVFLALLLTGGVVVAGFFVKPLKKQLKQLPVLGAIYK